MFYSRRRTTCKSRQQKKHYSQMTLQEKKDCVLILKNSFSKFTYFQLTDHFKHKSCTKIDFLLLRNYVLHNKYAYLNVIEYNETLVGNSKKRRIVFKYPTVVNINGIPCFQYLVVQDYKLITTYYNKIDDVHRTLDLRYYNKNLKISVDNS